MVTRRRSDNLPRQQVAVTDEASTRTLFHIGVLSQSPSLPDEEIALLGEAAYYHFETAGQGISQESETLWQKNVYEAFGLYTLVTTRVRRLVADKHQRRQ